MFFYRGAPSAESRAWIAVPVVIRSSPVKRKGAGQPEEKTLPCVARQRALRVAARSRLLPWFEREKRVMPWRSRRTPYRVWISEIMLQQTRVDQARPYFDAFLKKFPHVQALAAAPLDAVLKAWEGLGYYARARHLHAAAQVIVRDHAGRFPNTPEAWAALPGIGPYTQAAIGSLAYGWPLAVVDGNVVRVLSRLLARKERAPAAYQDTARALLLKDRAGDCNEAWMELGATVCTPAQPRCGECPLRSCCRAFRVGAVGRFPPAPPRKKIPTYLVGAAVTLNRRGEVLIAQRKADSMLGGLWEFPGGKIEPGETMRQCIERELREELGLEIKAGAEWMVVRHAYSHFRIVLHVHRCRVVRGRPRALHCADWAWVPVSGLRTYAFSRADLHIVERLEKETP